MLPTSLLSYMEYNYDPTVSSNFCIVDATNNGLNVLIEKRWD